MSQLDIDMIRAFINGHSTVLSHDMCVVASKDKTQLFYYDHDIFTYDYKRDILIFRAALFCHTFTTSTMINKVNNLFKLLAKENVIDRYSIKPHGNECVKIFSMRVLIGILNVDDTFSISGVHMKKNIETEPIKNIVKDKPTITFNELLGVC